MCVWEAHLPSPSFFAKILSTSTLELPTGWGQAESFAAGRSSSSTAGKAHFPGFVTSLVHFPE